MREATSKAPRSTALVAYGLKNDCAASAECALAYYATKPLGYGGNIEWLRAKTLEKSKRERYCPLPSSCRKTGPRGYFWNAQVRSPTTNFRQEFCDVFSPKVALGYVDKPVCTMLASVDYDSPKGPRLCEEIGRTPYFAFDLSYLFEANTPLRKATCAHKNGSVTPKDLIPQGHPNIK
jgi:hypothetical protein